MRRELRRLIGMLSKRLEPPAGPEVTVFLPSDGSDVDLPPGVHRPRPRGPMLQVFDGTQMQEAIDAGADAEQALRSALGEAADTTSPDGGFPFLKREKNPATAPEGRPTPNAAPTRAGDVPPVQSETSAIVPAREGDATTPDTGVARDSDTGAPPITQEPASVSRAPAAPVSPPGHALRLIEAIRGLKAYGE